MSEVRFITLRIMLFLINKFVSQQYESRSVNSTAREMDNVKINRHSNYLVNNSQSLSIHSQFVKSPFYMATVFIRSGNERNILMSNPQMETIIRTRILKRLFGETSFPQGKHMRHSTAFKSEKFNSAAYIIGKTNT